MTLRASLVIGGDAKGAIAAVDATATAVGKLSTAERGAVGAAETMAASQTKAIVAAGGLGRELARVRDAADPAGAAQRKLAAETDLLNTALARGAITVDQHGARLRELQQATNGVAGVSARAAAGTRQLGQQFGDLAVMIQGGIDPARAFVTQAGQIGYAQSEMGGKAGAVGAFLVGPWGIALTIAVSALAPMVQELFKGGEAMKDLELSSNAVASAQGVLSQQFDMVTGAIKRQTAASIVNSQALALQLLRQAQVTRSKANATIDAAGVPGVKGSLFGIGQVVAGSAGNSPELVAAGLGNFRGNADVRKLRDDFRSAMSNTDEIARGKAVAAIIRKAAGTKFAGSGTDETGFVQAIRDRVQAYEDARTARDVQRSIETGTLTASLRQTGPKGGRSRTSSPAKTGAVAEFGRDAAARFAGIAEQFDETAPAMKRVNGALRQVDDLLEDIGRKRPPNWQALVVQGEQLRDVIRDGLTAPLRDFVEGQQQSFAIGQALIAGDQGRAEALRTIASLERQMGPLTEAQKDAVLGTVQGLEAQARQLDILREKQQVYLNGLGSIRSIVDDATQAFVRGDLGQFIKTPGKLLQAFQTLQGQALFNKMFDGAFRELQDQITGTSIVEDASQRMADAVGAVSRQTDRTTAALGDLARAASGAAGAVGAGPTSGVPGVPGTSSAAAGLGGGFGALLGLAGSVGASFAGVPGAGGGSNVDPTTGDIVVRGAPRIMRDPTALFTEALGKVGGSIGRFLGVKDPAQFGKDIGTASGKALSGAATGAMVGNIANSVGIKMSRTGSQIGGAIGSFVPIPGGQIIGSVLGGLVGNMFQKPKTGSANITNAADGPTLSGTNKALKAESGALAQSVQQGIAQIAEQLGGTLGAFNVSIGTYKGTYRVNTAGGATNGKNKGFTDYGEDPAVAVQAAIRDAIADGGILGLSARVQKAIASSPDVDKALKEALKVQQLELTIGGIGAQIGKAFRDFEAQAKERVRLAGAYGFDLVEIERRNAEDRGKLTGQLLREQVGSLQSLVEEMTSGSLFEGSAIDRLKNLDVSIAKAKADLDAGVEGAADSLAGLYQQKLSASKEAYGTTGGYAADRADTLDNARAAIATANARIVAAQATEARSDPALSVTNAALDENNDQNSRIIAALDRLDERLAAGMVRPTPGINMFERATY